MRLNCNCVYHTNIYEYWGGILRGRFTHSYYSSYAYTIDNRRQEPGGREPGPGGRRPGKGKGGVAACVALYLFVFRHGE